jgi:hypothetical protein
MFAAEMRHAKGQDADVRSTGAGTPGLVNAPPFQLAVVPKRALSLVRNTTPLFTPSADGTMQMRLPVRRAGSVPQIERQALSAHRLNAPHDEVVQRPLTQRRTCALEPEMHCVAPSAHSAHAPVGRHARPAAQLPHDPPHPSLPQVRPAHCGTHAQRPVLSHVVPAAQVPHDPPHPSLPQVRPAHCGAHSQRPVLSHVVPAAQVPHDPPHPSLPQVRPAHCGAQVGRQLWALVLHPLRQFEAPPSIAAHRASAAQ